MRTSARRLWVVVAVVGTGAAGAVLTAKASPWSDSFRELASDNAEVRKKTIETLISGGRGALPDLLEGLRDEESALVKAGIAEAISKIDIDEEAAADLKAFLTSNDASTRAGAIAAPSGSRPDLAADELHGRATDASERP